MRRRAPEHLLLALGFVGLSACGSCGKGSEPENAPPEAPPRAVGPTIGKAITTSTKETVVPQRALLPDGGIRPQPELPK